MANPTGKGGFKPGQSGNPTGRAGRHIGDLSKEARRYAQLALGTLVRICKEGQERNRLSAALALLDRGYGAPVRMLDIVQAGRKITELNPDELANFEARIVTAAQAADTEPAQSDMFH